MKHLLNLTTLAIVFIAFVQVHAQDTTPDSTDNTDNTSENKLCDTSWWQELEPAEITTTENMTQEEGTKTIDIDDLYNLRCIHHDGYTPAMVAYKAGVSDEMMGEIFTLATSHALFKLLTMKTTRGKDLNSIVEDDFGPTAQILVSSKNVLFRIFGEETGVSLR